MKFLDRDDSWRSAKGWAILLSFCAFTLPILAVPIDNIFLGLVDTGVFVLFAIPCLLSGAKLQWDKITLFCILFLVALAFSLAWNLYMGNASKHNLILYIRLLFIFSVLASACFLSHISSFYLRVMIVSVYLGLLISLLLGCWLFFENKFMQPGQQVMWFTNGKSHVRAGGLIGNTGTYGHQVFMFYAIGMFLWLSSKKNSWMSSIIFVVTVSASFFFITISSSRGSFIGIMLFTICMIPAIWKTRRISVFPLVGVSVAIFISISFATLSHAVINYSMDRFWINHLVSHQHPHSQKQDARKSTDSSAHPVPSKIEPNKEKLSDTKLNQISSGRIQQWKTYLELSSKHPWLGVGYKNAENNFHMLMDNSVVSILIEGGWCSLIPFILIWVSMLIGAVKIFMHSNFIMGCFLFALVLANFLQSLLVDIYTQWYSFPIFLLIFMSCYYKYRRNYSADDRWP